jgi:hypothetical protein
VPGLRQEGPISFDQDQVRDFARSYTEAWCSHDPARVAAHFVPGGTIAINGGDPTEITGVARSFIDAFPDIEVFMDDIVFRNETVEFHWTFTARTRDPTAPERPCGSQALRSGHSATTGSSSNRRATTTRNEYDRQLEHGAPATS